MTDLVVFDTNVLMNALRQRAFERPYADARALEQVWNNGQKLAFSQPTMDELAVIIRSENTGQLRDVSFYNRYAFLGEIQNKGHSEKVEPTVSFTGCKDVEDNKIANVALTVGSVIVTHDKELLDLAGSTVQAGNLKTPMFVMTPADYLKMQRKPLTLAFNALGEGALYDAKIVGRPKHAVRRFVKT